MNAYFFNMNPSERENILKQHQTVYDGYAVRESSPKENPIMVQDFANDKGGITVNSRGEVKTYTNVGINESIIREEKEMCSECGSEMYEGECKECGYNSDDMVMIADLGEDIDDGELYSDEEPGFDFKSGGPEQFDGSYDDVDPYDLDLDAIQKMFDYEDIHGDGDTGENMMDLQSKMDNEFDGKEKMSGEWDSYNFDSGGPIDDFEEIAEEKDDDGIELPDNIIAIGEEEYHEIDEDLREDFRKQRQKISEMFNRFSKYN